MNSKNQTITSLDITHGKEMSDGLSVIVVSEPVNNTEPIDRLTTEQIISHEAELNDCKKCCKGSKTVFCGIFCCCVHSWSCCLNSVEVCCSGCSIMCICMSSVALCCKSALEQMDCDGN